MLLSKKNFLNTLVVSFLFAFSILLLTTELKAQPEMCENSCPGTPWTYRTKTINPPPNCPICTNIVVQYWDRMNCRGRYEIYIVDWISSQACRTCFETVYSDSFYAYWVKSELLRYNPITDNLLNGECIDIEAGFDGYCYMKVDINSPLYPFPVTKYVKCQGAPCCMNLYRLCKYNDRMDSPIFIETLIASGETCGNGCFPVCNDF